MFTTYLFTSNTIIEIENKNEYKSKSSACDAKKITFKCEVQKCF